MLWSLFSKIKVTCVPIACFIFSLFKCLLFHFLYCAIRMHISIPTGVQNECICRWKKNYWSLIFKMKVTCMPIFWFLFRLFNAIPTIPTISLMPSLFVLQLWYTYAYSHSDRCSKCTVNWWKITTIDEGCEL